MNNRRYSRLSKEDRRVIEKGLNRKDSLGSLAIALNRSTSTISREIQRNSCIDRKNISGEPFNNCLLRGGCREYSVCSKEDCDRPYCKGCRLCIYACKKYVRETCPKLSRPPYVCNGCRQRKSCPLEKFLYTAVRADHTAREVHADARRGVVLDESERLRISSIVSPLIKQGQSPYHICLTNKNELMISDKTLYKYIEAGLMDVTNIDLTRKVRMRPRKKKHTVKIERRCRVGRTYRDYLAFMGKYPDTAVVQMDSVIGKKGGGEKCLLTLCFPKSELMLAFIRDANTARSVTAIFDALKLKLGYELFTSLFGVLLTDNGSEFSAPSSIELDEATGTVWTSIYYCDPNCAVQKAAVESGHRMIRNILPKGTSMNKLSQGDINLMMSHINSYKRKALGGKSPIEIFSDIYGTETIKRLDLKHFPHNEITLRPSPIK